MIKEAMQQWADKALARTASQRAALILAFDREAYHCTGYCWGVPRQERGNRLEPHIGDLDAIGVAMANDVWEKEGCVLVSVWSQQGHKQRQFTPPHDMGGMPEFPAWVVNVLMLEGRVAGHQDDLRSE
jgi:hypothetical protein